MWMKMWQVWEYVAWLLLSQLKRLHLTRNLGITRGWIKKQKCLSLTWIWVLWIRVVQTQSWWATILPGFSVLPVRQRFQSHFSWWKESSAWLQISWTGFRHFCCRLTQKLIGKIYWRPKRKPQAVEGGLNSAESLFTRKITFSSNMRH